MFTERLGVSTGAGSVGRRLCCRVLHNRQAVLQIRTGSAQGPPESADREHASHYIARQQAGPCSSPRGESSSSIMCCMIRI